jgi:hypothetical protein
LTEQGWIANQIREKDLLQSSDHVQSNVHSAPWNAVKLPSRTYESSTAFAMALKQMRESFEFGDHLP